MNTKKITKIFVLLLCLSFSIMPCVSATITINPTYDTFSFRNGGDQLVSPATAINSTTIIFNNPLGFYMEHV